MSWGVVVQQIFPVPSGSVSAALQSRCNYVPTPQIGVSRHIMQLKPATSHQVNNCFGAAQRMWVAFGTQTNNYFCQRIYSLRALRQEWRSCSRSRAEISRKIVTRLLTEHRLCGLVVRVPVYRSIGTGFDSRRYQVF
jgi:hypothetical protein